MAEHRRDLRDFAGGAQPVQARHQGVVQGDGNLVNGRFSGAAFEHRASQFLDKQGHSAAAFDQRLDRIGAQGRAGRQPCNDLAGGARAQPGQRQLHVMRPQGPGCAELRTRRADQHQRRKRGLLGDQLNRLQR